MFNHKTVSVGDFTMIKDIFRAP